MDMHEPRDIEAAIREGSALDRAIVATRRRVVGQHRQTRAPLVIWRDGRVVEVAPETVTLTDGVATVAQRGH